MHRVGYDIPFIADQQRVLPGFLAVLFPHLCPNLGRHDDICKLINRRGKRHTNKHVELHDQLIAEEKGQDLEVECSCESKRDKR